MCVAQPVAEPAVRPRELTPVCERPRHQRVPGCVASPRRRANRPWERSVGATSRGPCRRPGSALCFTSQSILASVRPVTEEQSLLFQKCSWEEFS